MCEVCDAKAKCELLRSQIAFRSQQHLVELSVSDEKAATRVELAIYDLNTKLFQANKDLIALVSKRGKSTSVRH